MNLFNTAYTVRPATERMPVLCTIFLRCEITVWGEMFSSEAISLFVRPRATRTSTSRSRSESSWLSA